MPAFAIQSRPVLLREYAAGEPVDLSQAPLELPDATAFQQRVRTHLMKVGYGATISYGALAALAGAPGAARAVGTVMSTNPVPLVIPCHRVVGSGGRLGGYSAPTGLDLKRRLLRMESGELPAGSAGEEVQQHQRQYRHEQQGKQRLRIFQDPEDIEQPA